MSCIAHPLPTSTRSFKPWPETTPKLIANIPEIAITLFNLSSSGRRGSHHCTSYQANGLVAYI
jgi:hypothetical protein